jgi:hypothetical protein
MGVSVQPLVSHLARKGEKGIRATWPGSTCKHPLKQSSHFVQVISKVGACVQRRMTSEGMGVQEDPSQLSQGIRV